MKASNARNKMKETIICGFYYQVWDMHARA